MRTTRALAALTLGLSLVLAGCGNDNPDPGSTGTNSSGHNEADVRFATDMIQHHAQALAMVDITRERKLDPQVQDLAEKIREAQAPEIETMTDWLQEWDEEIPATVRDHVNAEGHGGHDMGEETDGPAMDMPGMMSEDDMAELEAASDADFQDMWVTMMIEHHQGAIDMAKTQQSEGNYQPAIDLAEEIETAQQAEIETMQALLS